MHTATYPVSHDLTQQHSPEPHHHHHPAPLLGLCPQLTASCGWAAARAASCPPESGTRCCSCCCLPCRHPAGPGPRPPAGRGSAACRQRPVRPHAGSPSPGAWPHRQVASCTGWTRGRHRCGAGCLRVMTARSRHAGGWHARCSAIYGNNDTGWQRVHRQASLRAGERANSLSPDPMSGNSSAALALERMASVRVTARMWLLRRSSALCTTAVTALWEQGAQGQEHRNDSIHQGNTPHTCKTPDRPMTHGACAGLAGDACGAACGGGANWAVTRICSCESAWPCARRPQILFCAADHGRVQQTDESRRRACTHRDELPRGISDAQVQGCLACHVDHVAACSQAQQGLQQVLAQRKNGQPPSYRLRTCLGACLLSCAFLCNQLAATPCAPQSHPGGS